MLGITIHRIIKLMMWVVESSKGIQGGFLLLFIMFALLCSFTAPLIDKQFTNSVACHPVSSLLDFGFATSLLAFYSYKCQNAPSGYSFGILWPSGCQLQVRMGPCDCEYKQFCDSHSKRC